MVTKYERIGRNTEELVKSTEWFATLMYFLYNERNQNMNKLKIGTFSYDNDWNADIYCHLTEVADDEVGGMMPSIYFTTIKNSYGNVVESKYMKLTDLCFGWEFEYSTITINWKIIDDYLRLLNLKDKDTFIEYYDELHSTFW